MADSLRIAGIMRESIVDGPGIRFAVFCQGCPHDCPGCHNPETHDPAGGNEVKIDRILQEFDKNPLLSGMTFSGGEPMCQPDGFAELGRAVKARGKNITIYTGYTLEQLLKMAENTPAVGELLEMCDILIDGPFIMDKRDLNLQFRGSSNQRVIDMNRTREEKKIVLWEG